MATDGPVTVDDLLTPLVADSLGESTIATAAVVIVATASLEGGSTLHLRIPEDVPTHLAMGMLRSCLNRLEAADLASWEGME